MLVSEAPFDWRQAPSRSVIQSFAAEKTCSSRINNLATPLRAKQVVARRHDVSVSSNLDMAVPYLGPFESLLGLQTHTGNYILTIFVVIGISGSRLVMVPRRNFNLFETVINFLEHF